MEDLIRENCTAGEAPSLLLHSCCAPCSSYCIACLAEHFHVTVFYYNPNIYPPEEYHMRAKEQEGPIVAQRMLSDVGIENYLIDRICYLIGHHHTYDNIEGLDYQILVEADFLVNLYEDDVNRHGIEQAYQQIFRTQTGKEIFNQMYTDER